MRDDGEHLNDKALNDNNDFLHESFHVKKGHMAGSKQEDGVMPQSALSLFFYFFFFHIYKENLRNGAGRKAKTGQSE